MSMTTNGPAIWGGCVTRRKHRAESWYPAPAGPQSCHGARRVWRTFCRPGTNFIEHYACRDTSMIGAGKLSRYRILFAGTGAVSRYKLSRSQKIIKVQDFNCGQMRALPTEAERRCVSGCKNHYKFVLSAGAKAKTVTNNLPILSVLAVGFIYSFQLLFYSRFVLNTNVLFLLFCFFQIEF